MSLAFSNGTEEWAKYAKKFLLGWNLTGIRLRDNGIETHLWGTVVHIRDTVAHLRNTVAHLRYHCDTSDKQVWGTDLRGTVTHLRDTVGHLRDTVAHLRNRSEGLDHAIIFNEIRHSRRFSINIRVYTGSLACAWRIACVILCIYINPIIQVLRIFFNTQVRLYSQTNTARQKLKTHLCPPYR